MLTEHKTHLLICLKMIVEKNCVNFEQGSEKQKVVDP